MGSRKGRRGAGGLVRARGHLRSSREEDTGVSGAGEKLGRTSCFPSAKSSQTPQNALRHREWARASCVTTPGTPKEKVGACLDAHTHKPARRRKIRAVIKTTSREMHSQLVFITDKWLTSLTFNGSYKSATTRPRENYGKTTGTGRGELNARQDAPPRSQPQRVHSCPATSTHQTAKTGKRTLRADARRGPAARPSTAGRGRNPAGASRGSYNEQGASKM